MLRCARDTRRRGDITGWWQARATHSSLDRFLTGQGNMQKFLITLAFVLVASLSGARADNFPSRPITLIVPFPPGGSTDVAARIMADKMGASLGKPVIVENVGGAGGSIGVG